jgi:hypothetical protein
LSEGDISLVFPRKIFKTPIKTSIDELVKDIKFKEADSSTRLQKFLKEYEKEFNEDLVNKRLLFDITETEVLHMMKGALTFYALNMNGQVLIELAGLLERYAIIYIEELFKSLRSVQLFTEGQYAIEEMLEKKFLRDLAKHLITLGLWDKEDEKKVQKLYEKRNFVAHKNIKKLEGILSSNNKSISIPEIDVGMSNFYVLPYMFITIRLLFKLLDRFLFKSERYRIAKALLDCKIFSELEYFKGNSLDSNNTGTFTSDSRAVDSR